MAQVSAELPPGWFIKMELLALLILSRNLSQQMFFILNLNFRIVLNVRYYKKTKKCLTTKKNYFRNMKLPNIEISNIQPMIKPGWMKIVFCIIKKATPYPKTYRSATTLTKDKRSIRLSPLYRVLCHSEWTSLVW